MPEYELHVEEDYFEWTYWLANRGPSVPNYTIFGSKYGTPACAFSEDLEMHWDTSGHEGVGPVKVPTYWELV